jgi:DedD protein
MDDRVKKRLVGAAILVSLFVIFAPMVLDPNRLGAPEEATPIPPPPIQPFPGRLLRLDAPKPDLSPPPEPLAEGVPFEVPAEPLPPPDPGPVLPPAPPAAAAAPLVRPSASAGPKPADKAPPTPTPPPVAAPPVATSPIVTAPAAPPAAAEGAEPEPRSGDSRVGLSAWAVQLSSFANAANAIALRDALRGRGFVAFVESAPDRTTRVYLGPDLQKGNAVAAQQRLSRDLGIKGTVVPYPAPTRSGGAAGDAPARP